LILRIAIAHAGYGTACVAAYLADFERSFHPPKSSAPKN
jgi:hypothetical protein